MAIVIETCPKCGHDLRHLVIATYPPIPRKECCNCDWSWEGEVEEIVRVPFDGIDKRASANLIIDDITDMVSEFTIDDITDMVSEFTKEDIEEYMKCAVNRMITNYVEKYYED